MPSRRMQRDRRRRRGRSGAPPTLSALARRQHDDRRDVTAEDVTVDVSSDMSGCERGQSAVSLLGDRRRRDDAVPRARRRRDRRAVSAEWRCGQSRTATIAAAARREHSRPICARLDRSGPIGKGRCRDHVMRLVSSCTVIVYLKRSGSRLSIGPFGGLALRIHEVAERLARRSAQRRRRARSCRRSSSSPTIRTAARARCFTRSSPIARLPGGSSSTTLRTSAGSTGTQP